MKWQIVASLSLLGMAVHMAVARGAAAENSAGSLPAAAARASGANLQLAMFVPMEDLQRARQQAADSYRRMQYDDAVDAYKRVCQSTASNARDVYMLAEALYHSGQYGQSAEYFNKVATMDPHFDTARVRAASAYIAAKRLDTARDYCRYALQMVTDPYAQSQLKVLAKIVSMPELKRPAHQQAICAGRQPGER